MDVVRLFRFSMLALAGMSLSALHAQESNNTNSSHYADNPAMVQGEQADQAIQGDANTETENWMKWKKQLEEQLSRIADQEKKAMQDEEKTAQALTAARNSVEAERAKPTKQDDLFVEQKKLAEMEKGVEQCQQNDLQALAEEHRLELERLSKQVDLWAIKALLKPTQAPPIQSSQSMSGSNP